MPLSEEELRLLEQMERALAEEDPKFVSTLQGRVFERSARLRTALAALAFLIGLGMLVGGAFAQLPALSIAGFVVMVASATLGLSAWRGRHAFAEGRSAGPHAGSAPGAGAHPSQGGAGAKGFTVIDGGRRGRRNRQHPRQRAHGSFMQRMEERWERRRNQGF